MRPVFGKEGAAQWAAGTRVWQGAIMAYECCHPDLAPRNNDGALTRCALPPLPSHRSSV